MSQVLYILPGLPVEKRQQLRQSLYRGTFQEAWNRAKAKLAEQGITQPKDRKDRAAWQEYYENEGGEPGAEPATAEGSDAAPEGTDAAPEAAGEAEAEPEAAPEVSAAPAPEAVEAEAAEPEAAEPEPS